jgi:hypothetical protein
VVRFAREHDVRPRDIVAVDLVASVRAIVMVA